MASKPNEIKRELKKWEERVIWDVQFKPNTTAKLTVLDQILNRALEHFVMISANSEALVYKIGRYFITDHDFKNEDIVFINDKVLKSYIGDTADHSADWKKKERLDNFFDTFGKSYTHKWVFLPYCDFPISVGLAYYFVAKLQQYGVYGFVFYGDENIQENISETLVLEYDDRSNFIQFPRAKYVAKKRQRVDDEY